MRSIHHYGGRISPEAIGYRSPSLKVVDNDSEIRSALALSSAAEDSIVLVEEWV